jgi:Leucine-rich repeat (LRR) protein
MNDSSRVQEPGSLGQRAIKTWGGAVFREGSIAEPSTLLQWRRFLYYRTTKLSLMLQQADQLNNIHHLNMEDQSIEDEDVYLLSIWLAYNRWHAQCANISTQMYSNLTTLNLQQCTLSHVQCEYILRAVAGSKTLTSLNMSGNNIGGFADEDDYFVPYIQSGKELANLVGKNKSLTWLSCRYCHMGMLTLCEIAKAMKHNESITYLNLGSNSWWWDERTDELLSDHSFDSTGIFDFAENLCKHNHTLLYTEILSTEFQPLQLNGKHLELVASGEDIDKSLSFRDKRLGRIDLIFIIECIKYNKYCTNLNFSGCTIEKQAAESVASYLEKDGCLLEIIDLSHIQTREKDALRLAKAALKSPRLKLFASVPLQRVKANEITNLMLNGAGIGPHGCIVLCDLLSRPGQTSLTRLYLAKNNIFTFGVKGFEVSFYREYYFSFGHSPNRIFYFH